MIRFADPWAFFLLLFLIPIFTRSYRGGGKVRFSSLETLKSLGKSQSFWKNPRNILVLLRALAFICFVLGLTRPQTGKKFSEVSSEGVDIMLVLDTSGSMKALDFQLEGNPVDRLEVVKKVVTDFVHKRPGDRIGLIVFGDEAFTQCPLTLDHGIVLDFLKKMEIGMAGEATAIGSALGMAVKRMKDLPAKAKVIILLTDGQSNAGRIPPLKAAELAKHFNIKVYTIGVGSKGKAPFLVDTFFGKRYVYQDVDLDEETLREIAKITKAQYFRATQTTELEAIYTDIDKLEKTEIKVKEYTEYNELFSYFLLAGILFLLLEIVLGQTKYRKIP